VKVGLTFHVTPMYLTLIHFPVYHIKLDIQSDCIRMKMGVASETSAMHSSVGSHSELEPLEWEQEKRRSPLVMAGALNVLD